MAFGRKGEGFDMPVAVVLGVILALFVLGLALVFGGTFFNNTQNDLNSFKSCEGLVGTLGGKTGVCFDNAASVTKCDPAVKPPDTGYYWQYIGPGWSCKDTQYCCMEISNAQNPATASQIAAAKAQNAGFVCPQGQSPSGCVGKPVGTLVTQTESNVLKQYSCQKNGDGCQLHYEKDLTTLVCAHVTVSSNELSANDPLNHCQTYTAPCMVVVSGLENSYFACLTTNSPTTCDQEEVPAPQRCSYAQNNNLKDCQTGNPICN